MTTRKFTIDQVKSMVGENATKVDGFSAMSVGAIQDLHENPCVAFATILVDSDNNMWFGYAHDGDPYITVELLPDYSSSYKAQLKYVVDQINDYINSAVNASIEEIEEVLKAEAEKE